MKDMQFCVPSALSGGGGSFYVEAAVDDGELVLAGQVLVRIFAYGLELVKLKAMRRGYVRLSEAMRSRRGSHGMVAQPGQSVGVISSRRLNDGKLGEKDGLHPTVSRAVSRKRRLAQLIA
ncbi:MAG: hypothetical protein ABTQ34_01875 [Bdellovibrionales bacterium]